MRVFDNDNAKEITQVKYSSFSTWNSCVLNYDSIVGCYLYYNYNI